MGCQNVSFLLWSSHLGIDDLGGQWDAKLVSFLLWSSPLGIDDLAGQWDAKMHNFYDVDRT